MKEKEQVAGLEDRISFPGEAPVHEIAGWYKTLFLFFAPQRWEGFGLMPLEAMGSGVPVVATTVGVFPELVIDCETGTLIESGDIAQMVEAAESYLNDSKNQKPW